MSTSVDLGRPVSGDVIDLILDDHRRFESLLRQLRDSSSARDAVRQAFAALHVAHALAEEELTILNPARDDVAERTRAELGEAFATARNRHLDDDCGRLAHVRRIVRDAEREGLLDDE